MTAAHPVFHTFAEYEELEGHSPLKHEYVGGRINAMAGGEPSIEVRRRDTNGHWTTVVAWAGERIALSSVACTLDVNAIYESASDPRT